MNINPITGIIISIFVIIVVGVLIFVPSPHLEQYHLREQPDSTQLPELFEKIDTSKWMNQTEYNARKLDNSHEAEYNALQETQRDYTVILNNTIEIIYLNNITNPNAKLELIKAQCSFFNLKYMGGYTEYTENPNDCIVGLLKRISI